MNRAPMIFQSHRAAEVGIGGFVGYSRAAGSELKRCSVFIFEHLVVFKLQIGRNVLKGLCFLR